MLAPLARRAATDLTSLTRFVTAASRRPSHSVRRAVATTASAAMADDKFSLPERYKGTEKNIWVEFIQLALEHKPLNLGQGFPDYGCPKHVTEGLAEVMHDPNLLLNQYTRGYGHPRLVNALAKLYSGLLDRTIDPFTEVLVSQGAYGCLYNAILGHVKPGDEVIIIEPFFDCYQPMVKIAGGTPVFVPLRPRQDAAARADGALSSADWVLDPAELRAAFGPRTKMIILNTPNNPLGKVFTRPELELIAELCQSHNALCLSDEVYEWMVFKPAEHIRIAGLPGMWDRTITVGSAGKTFSVTGWKLGWAYGPAKLMHNLQVVHQNTLYTCSTPLQEALARSFEHEMSLMGSPECYFTSLANDELRPKRDYMAQFLTDCGMKPVIPEGGYFMVADWTSLDKSKIDLSPYTPGKPDDHRFVYWLVHHHKLQGIPPSSFYSAEHKKLAEHYIRFCFIKDDKNLEKAESILKELKKSME
ncbi:kynurenine aminotransferase-like isoform X1 [Amphibalanus amphitrite]|nr:kynurenine aminotransferase-like isoform X1 [Amphibalanus amphitrite]XP_043242763.1 kynurenine aminotransferase-like isoform X1 [Amphibalanus amphitrite]